MSLSYNEISNTGAIALANSTRLGNLTFLRLIGTQINDEEVALAKSKNLTQLMRIKMQRNLLGPEGIKAIKDHHERYQQDINYGQLAK